MTFRAASQAEAHSRTAGPRRIFCAARMFELSDAEFEALWPGLERLLNNTGRPWDALDVETAKRTAMTYFVEKRTPSWLMA